MRTGHLAFSCCRDVGDAELIAGIWRAYLDRVGCTGGRWAFGCGAHATPRGARKPWCTIRRLGDGDGRCLQLSVEDPTSGIGWMIVLSADDLDALEPLLDAPRCTEPQLRQFIRDVLGRDVLS